MLITLSAVKGSEQAMNAEKFTFSLEEREEFKSMGLPWI